MVRWAARPLALWQWAPLVSCAGIGGIGLTISSVPAHAAAHSSASSPWVEYVDEVSGKPYYFNTQTQQTTWDKPY